MAYSTAALVRQALVPSSDGTQPNVPTNTAADLTNAQLADAIAEADALIDGYINRFYVVPVMPVDSGSGPVVPHPLDYWSRNIAAYNATLAFRGSLDFADTDPVARRYSATMEALKAVSAGTISLPYPRNQADSGTGYAAEAINPYVGDLFCVSDFDLTEPWNPWRGPFWGGR